MEVIINGTRYKCMEYAKSINISEEAKGWQHFEDAIELDDEGSYLVSWKSADGGYSNPVRAYWDEDEESFFPVDCHFSFPLAVDIYFKLPDFPMSS